MTDTAAHHHRETKARPKENSDAQASSHYQLVAKAIEYLAYHRSQQPSLSQLAQALTTSESHLQRIFSEWAGVSPKQFLQFLTKENAKKALQLHSVLDTAHEIGLSGSSRLHDLMITFEAATPGEIKSGGKGLNVAYGTHLCPFGYAFIAVTERGLCKLTLFDDVAESTKTLTQLRHDWPQAELQEDRNRTKAIAQQVFEPINNTDTPIHLLMKGSPFKLKVWEALLKIPTGQLRSYQDIATAIKQPTATRAVASAIASNDIAVMIPCHRVIRSTGELSQYRWGATRKAALLGWEQALKV